MWFWFGFDLKAQLYPPSAKKALRSSFDLARRPSSWPASSQQPLRNGGSASEDA